MDKKRDQKMEEKKMQNCEKYEVGYFMPPVESMKWTQKDHIEKAPTWCSVDLRDGNQALVVPMSLEQKLEFFTYLVQIGFKEIEVGFPAASETEYKFVRTLIEQNMIPDDVKIQVLTQSREHIINKTFEAVRGGKNVIVHLYNSVSKVQREEVFKASKEEVKQIAEEGARLIKKTAATMPETNFWFEYSPESFTGTEPEYAAEVCNAVIDIWQPTPWHKMYINLPSTVQMSMPHVYASQIEYMSDHLHHRDSVVISLHPHNDRGTGVADAECGMLAGAERIEGTLFGNGERTGNVDVVTIAMNMFTHGVDPELDFSDMPDVVEHYEKYTDMTVHERHPYAGSLVFAAFSGSHQDAIAKGMKYREEKDINQWCVPYIPVDPTDLGREYGADVIRINSQSGKGGVAYILEQDFGFHIPKAMREEIGYMMKSISDHEHKELAPEEIFSAFDDEYINDFDFVDITAATFTQMSEDYKTNQGMKVNMEVTIDDNRYQIEASGTGRLDAVRNALRKTPYMFDYDFVTYEEHSLELESTSRAAAYVAISDANGWVYWGCGVHNDIIPAAINALVSAINRMNRENGSVERKQEEND